MKCSVLEVDMATFSCGQECDKFCKPKECGTDNYWKTKVKPGRPSSWSLESEKTVEWTANDKKQVLDFLSRLPEDLKKIDFEGLFRMKKSVEFINPGTTSIDGKAIVIYDRAFNNPNWDLNNVIAHELGHVVFINMGKAKQQNYLLSLGWGKTQENGFKKRTGDFISSRAKDSYQEDFAENFSAFLLEPEILKRKVPKADKWFSTVFQKFNLKKECNK